MYTNISICVNHAEERSEVIKLALGYAQQLKAKLTGFYLKTDVHDVHRWQMNVPLAYCNKMLVDIENYEAENRQHFEKLAESFNIEIQWMAVKNSKNFFNDILCTDLIIVEQPQKSNKHFTSEQSFLNNLIIETKRPVLMIPNSFNNHSIGSNILIGWNSSAEAMRATSDAMPLLKSAEKVLTLKLLKEKELDSQHKHAYDIQHYLNNQNIKSHLIIDSYTNKEIMPEKLHQFAIKEDINMIVIGGYGHSRLRELIMGGVTNYLIQYSTIPVFFSH